MIAKLKSLYRSLFRYTELKASDIYDAVEWHGDPVCPCGSGKKPDECCFKEFRSDKHPLSVFKKYRVKYEMSPLQSGSEFGKYPF